MSEELKRHRCECREWMRRRVRNGADWMRQVLADIEKKRGAAAAKRISDDFIEQWKRGNRGAYGDWR